MAFRIGIDVGGTKIAVGLCDAHFNLLGITEFSNNNASGCSDITNEIVNHIDALCKNAGISGNRIKAIGYGFPAEFNELMDRVLKAPNNDCFLDKDPRGLLKTALSKKYGIEFEITIDNDACVAAIAEAKMGAGQFVDCLLYLTISTDVGGARYYNEKAINIEPGHYVYPDPMQPNECLSNLGGGIAIVSLTKRRIRKYIQEETKKVGSLTNLFDFVDSKDVEIQKNIETITAKDVSQAALQRDVFCREILRENAQHVASAILILLSQGFDEKIVILGGSVSTKIPFYVDDVRNSLDHLEKNRPTLRQGATSGLVHVAELGEERGVIGAALTAATSNVVNS